MKKILVSAIVCIVAVGFYGCNEKSEETKVEAKTEMNMDMKAGTPEAATGLKSRKPVKAEIGKEVVCPVMKEKFKVSEFTEVFDYNGKAYFMCCSMCPDKFKNNPEKYVN